MLKSTLVGRILVPNDHYAISAQEKELPSLLIQSGAGSFPVQCPKDLDALDIESRHPLGVATRLSWILSSFLRSIEFVYPHDQAIVRLLDQQTEKFRIVARSGLTSGV